MSNEPGWGIRFPRRAAEGGGLPLIEAPLPARLVVPLQQNIGRPPQPLVRPGDQVQRGQPIARADDGEVSAWMHAPTSGTVTALEKLPIAAAEPGLCAIIAADGKDTPTDHYSARDPQQLDAAELRAALQESGIVGLGGALFPTHVKLNDRQGVKTLILNGVECEPHISCDDALMQYAPEQILQGARIMLRILGANRCVLGLKENSAAVGAVEEASRQLPDVDVRVVAAIYPAGDEAQLIRLVTGAEIPTGCLPADQGIVCQNVATAAAVARFFAAGEPLIDRLITVGGSGVHTPVNVRARIGTPISELIECAGGYTREARRLLMGGPMMGIALPDDELCVTKACNSIYVAGADELPDARPELPCIRCGECATACPVHLSPQVLLQAARANDFEQLGQLGITECMECGACDYVCPSAIPLTTEFRAAKQTRREIAFERDRAARAAQRFAAKTARKEQTEQQLDTPTEPLADARTALAELLKRTGTDKDEER